MGRVRMANGEFRIANAEWTEEHTLLFLRYSAFAIRISLPVLLVVPRGQILPTSRNRNPWHARVTPRAFAFFLLRAAGLSSRLVGTGTRILWIHGRAELSSHTGHAPLYAVDHSL